MSNVLTRMIGAAALLSCATIPSLANAQTRYYARSAMPQVKADAAPTSNATSPWQVVPSKSAWWSDCSGGVMTTTDVDATCPSGDCDAATKPTIHNMPCTPVKNCDAAFVSKASYFNCTRASYRNDVYSDDEARAFCSHFPDAIGCTRTNRQVRACLQSGTYVSSYASNTRATACR